MADLSPERRTAAIEPSASHTAAALKKANRIAKRRETPGRVIGDVKMGDCIHYVTAGEWSMHDLLFHLLDKTGPADVYAASWSITEDPVRQLITRIVDRRILHLHAILDWRTKVRCPAVLALAQANFTDIHLTNCHAKCTAIINKKWQIAIVGSANYTNNPRIETGVVHCDPTAATFHRDWILAQIALSDPLDMKG